jgi:hypothetical protein
MMVHCFFRDATFSIASSAFFSEQTKQELP